MYYNELEREWTQHYQPSNCVRLCYSQYGCCPILGKALDKKRGNVYYDLNTSRIRHDGTIFDGETITEIKKGIRFFEHPVSMDICLSFIKAQGRDEIWNSYKLNTYTSRKLADPAFHAEILNVRAESRPSRDLAQDLQDIRDGITVIHASDSEKLKNARKREHREHLKQEKVKRLEKKLLETGYWNMEPYSADRIHADKWLGMPRINELEEQRQQKLKAEQEKPVQLSLFDLM